VPTRTAHDILVAVRARTLSRAAVAIVAATTAAAVLSGCRSNVGVAATVNGDRISESTVSKYVTHEGADPSVAAQAEQQGQPLSAPQPFVLRILILASLFENALAKNGGVPGSGALAAVHDQAAQAVLQTAAAGRDVEREEGGRLEQIGVSASFAPVLVRAVEMNYILVSERLKSTPLSTALRKAGADVTVNPRYGAWDPKSLNLDDSDAAGLPGYLKLQPTPTPSAALGLPAP
jgi:hypothetical protein